MDWWTANSDRTLSEHGGNPNILWVHRDHNPYVINHNLAFDETALPDFWPHHIFASSRTAWTKTFRDEMQNVMNRALDDVDDFWNAMPPEWTEVESGITLPRVKNLL